MCLHRLRRWWWETCPAGLSTALPKRSFMSLSPQSRKGFDGDRSDWTQAGMDRSAAWGLRHKCVGAWTQRTHLKSAKKGASWPHAFCVSRETSWLTRPQEKTGYRGLPRAAIFSAEKDQLTGNKSAKTLGEAHGAKTHNFIDVGNFQLHFILSISGLPWWLSGTELACSAGDAC